MEILNTMSGRKETFIPQTEDQVGIYVCGPTTYNYIHLGNARPLVVFDTLRRYLQFKGYAVKYVQNFTDIDDKIIVRAREEGVDAAALSAKYVAEYFTDAGALNIRPADVHPKVSEHIPDIIELIRQLEAKGFAYAVDGDVYYRVRAFADYGKLSGRSQEEMLNGARVDVDERKEQPGDFALWKAAKPGEPAWDSPWGPGRPGWHIECSAMSTRYLGNTMDIHGGGADLIFPHHENEIAQSEAATGQPLARYWMHNGFITVNQEKMSKSLGNFFLLRDILARYSGAVIRFYLLSTHYRSPLDFDDGKLLESKKALARLQATLSRAEEFEREFSGRAATAPAATDFTLKIDEFKQAFIAALDNDFNTAAGVGALFDLAHTLNGRLDTATGSAEDLQDAAYGAAVLQELGDILGIFFATAAPGQAEQEKAAAQQVKTLAADLLKEIPDSAALQAAALELSAAPEDDLAALMAALLDLRQAARAAKLYALSDRIRDELKPAGVILEDTKEGARWKLADE
jgi:cysteinyl-tRNA synthetase